MIIYCIKSVVPRRKFNALGAMGLISTVFNAGMQDYQNRKNREAQEYMMREAQSFQRELNANSTLIQKQSLQRAGLPVSLMTGPGDYNTSTVLGDSASQNAPTIDGNLFMQAAQQKQNQPLVDAQVSKTDAETREIEERIKKLKEDTTGQSLQNEKQRFENSKLDEYFRLYVNEKAAVIRKTNSEAGLTELKQPQQYWENKFQEDSYSDRLQTIKDNLALIVANKDLTEEEKNTEIAKQVEAYASAAASRAAAKRDYAQAYEIEKLVWAKEQELYSKYRLNVTNARKLTAQAILAENDADWQDIEKSLKALGLGAKEVKGAVSFLKKLHSSIK